MIDKKDQIILNTLREHGRWSTQKISKKTLIPQTTILNRMKKMEEKGIITRYTVDLDKKKMGFGLTAFIFVKVLKHKEERVGKTEEIVLKHPRIESISRLMGEYDFVIKAHLRDMEDLDDLLVGFLRPKSFVKETQTTVILKEWKK